MIKDYDCTIEYHPRKSNIVADALSRRPESSLSHMRTGYLPLLVDLRALGVILEVEDSEALLATFHVRPLLKDQILAGQSQDPQIIKFKEEIEKKKESRASEARGEDTVTPYSSMEMGEDHYGICDRSSMDSEAT